MRAKARELLSKLCLYGISPAEVEVEVSNGNFVVRAYKHSDPVREAVRAIVRGRPLLELPLKTQVKEFAVPAGVLEDESRLRRLAEEIREWLWR